MPHPSHRAGVEPFATICPGDHPAHCQCEVIAATIGWTLDAAQAAVLALPVIDRYDKWWSVDGPDAIAAIDNLRKGAK